MANNELNDYIKEELASGTSKDNIKKSLLDNGWEEKIVDKAINDSSPNTSQEMPKKPSMNSEEKPQEMAGLEPRVAQKPSTLMPSKPGPQKGILAIIIIIVLGVLIAAGWFVYSKYFSMTPEKVLDKMQSASQEVTSASIKGKVEFKFPKEETTTPADEMAILPEFENVKIEFSGKSLTPTEGTEKSDINFTASADGSVILGANIKTFDTLNYLQITQLPAELSFFIDTSAIKNQWIKFDPLTLSSDLGLDAMMEEEKQTPDTEEMKSKLKELEEKYKDVKILSFVEEYENETINEVETYHYKVNIKEDQTKNIIMDAFNIMNPAVDATEKQEVEDILKNIKLPPVDLWIGKADFLPYKIAFDVKLKDLNLNDNDLEFGDNDMILVELMMSDFNQEFSIEEPKESKTFEELFQEMMGGMMMQGPGMFEEGDVMESSDDFDSTDFNLDTDGDGLEDFMEESWGTDKNNADTDGDGYSDYDEIQNGFNPAGEGALEDMEVFNFDIESELKP